MPSASTHLQTMGFEKGHFNCNSNCICQGIEVKEEEFFGFLALAVVSSVTLRGLILLRDNDGRTETGRQRQLVTSQPAWD